MEKPPMTRRWLKLLALATPAAAASSRRLSAAEGLEPRRFRAIGYGGGPVVMPGWDAPVFVDLGGIQCAQQIPALDNHGPAELSYQAMRGAVVGRTDSVRVEGGRLVATGQLFQGNDAARRILRRASAGFRWQAS